MTFPLSEYCEFRSHMFLPIKSQSQEQSLPSVHTEDVADSYIHIFKDTH